MRGDRRWYRFAGTLPLPALVWVLASFLAFPHEIFGQTPVGSEFRVNTFTTDSQQDPTVASTALGDFVVVWTSNLQDGGSRGVFGQRFSSAGSALGGEFQVNAHTVNRQLHASVASSASGDFVVAWDSYGQDGAYHGIFARRFSSAGAPVGNEFQVNTYTTDAQSDPSLAAEPDGDFVVVWQSGRQDDGGYGGVFGQRFSSAGAPIGGEFQINTFTPGSQQYPSVAMAADGRFVVAWESDHQDASSDVVAQRFSSEGAPLGGEIQVNTYTLNEQGTVTVAAHADGGFVVVWASAGGQDGESRGVFARRFSSAGDAAEGELQINAYTDGGEAVPALAVVPDGGFVVVWYAYSDAGGDGVFVRRFTSEGSPHASAFRVNSYTGTTATPAIASDGAGNFVVAWASYGQEDEEDEAGIFAQRFALATPSEVELDIDGDEQVDALTDGALVLRRLFGFAGTTLTNGVDTGGCSRCDAEAIEPYIAGLGLALDIDGDGAVEPLTDGLLVIRYLFGFTGTALTNGAVNTGVGNCTRCEADEIEPYLLGLTS